VKKVKTAAAAFLSRPAFLFPDFRPKNARAHTQKNNKFLLQEQQERRLFRKFAALNHAAVRAWVVFRNLRK